MTLTIENNGVTGNMDRGEVSAHASALNTLAMLLNYPRPDLSCLLDQTRATLRGLKSEADAHLQRFAEGMEKLSPEEREEVFTATFDLSPACVPYVSIHLFGEENFKRGEFMAALHARYAKAGFNAGSELPDHLATIIRFMTMVNESERREVMEFCLLGPLNKMLATLTDENPYRHLLAAMRTTLLAAHPGVQAAVSPLEQMRTHGAGCESLSVGCHCGAMAVPEPKQSLTCA